MFDANHAIPIKYFKGASGSVTLIASSRQFALPQFLPGVTTVIPTCVTLHQWPFQPIKLEVIFVNESAAHLYETPICTNQKLIAINDTHTRLVASVPYNSQLVWWLLGFGADVEVVRPAKLRTQLWQIAQAMVDNYSQ